MTNALANIQRAVTTAKAFFEHDELAGIVASAEKTGDLLDKVAQATKIFAAQQPDLADRVSLAMQAERLEAMSSAIGKGVGAINKFQTIASIFIIMRTLSPNAIREEPEVSAAMFGELFVHCGDLAGSLPPPANTFAPILKSSGTFFSDMYKAMNLESPHTERGRAMLQALEEIDEFGKR